MFQVSREIGVRLTRMTVRDGPVCAESVLMVWGLHSVTVPLVILGQAAIKVCEGGRGKKRERERE